MPDIVGASATRSSNRILDASDRSTVLAVLDGGGSALADAAFVDVGPFDFDGTIEQWTLLADQSGSVALDLWKDAYANFPPTIADTIVASAPPVLSSADHGQDSTLTGWTTSISAGDVIRVSVNGAATSITRVTLALKVKRT